MGGFLLVGPGHVQEGAGVSAHTLGPVEVLAVLQIDEIRLHRFTVEGVGLFLRLGVKHVHRGELPGGQGEADGGFLPLAGNHRPQQVLILVELRKPHEGKPRPGEGPGHISALPSPQGAAHVRRRQADGGLVPVAQGVVQDHAAGGALVKFHPWQGKISMGLPVGGVLCQEGKGPRVPRHGRWRGIALGRAGKGRLHRSGGPRRYGLHPRPRESGGQPDAPQASRQHQGAARRRRDKPQHPGRLAGGGLSRRQRVVELRRCVDAVHIGTIVVIHWNSPFSRSFSFPLARLRRERTVPSRSPVSRAISAVL